jgi:hypothetical protein
MKPTALAATLIAVAVPSLTNVGRYSMSSAFGRSVMKPTRREQELIELIRRGLQKLPDLLRCEHDRNLSSRCR